MAEAREALLAKVVAYYAEHGVRDTSLRTLAAEIGTSQRMLHYHFGSRGDVLAAVIEAIAAGQAAQIAELFAGESDPLAAGRRNWDATVEDAQTYGPLWFELATHAMRGEPYAAGLGEVMVAAQLREFTAVYAAHADPGKAARLARLTLAVGQGLIFDLLIDGDRAAADAAIEEFTDLVRRELGQR
ncbi:TetR/AcrR family transcriptional regulator [Nocardioides sp. GXZ039]|uniref:TetR/AcrR family transcriptional regulator n=1 Tax=Nocardioides sp. GXZ039 TaxID=3136018 RepID=UPI0030F40F7A